MNEKLKEDLRDLILTLKNKEKELRADKKLLDLWEKKFMNVKVISSKLTQEEMEDMDKFANELMIGNLWNQKK